MRGGVVGKSGRVQDRVVASPRWKRRAQSKPRRRREGDWPRGAVLNGRDFLEQAPIELLPRESGVKEYRLGIRTGTGRGAALSEPLCGVLICLIGDRHQGFLHRIPPVTSEAAARFLQGSEERVSIRGPDLGHLTGLLIGPECGTWNLEEVTVEAEVPLRFVCRATLGTRDDPAAFLAPLLPGHVIYGSGPAARHFTPEEAHRLQQASLKTYALLKTRILATNAVLVFLACLIEAALWRPEFAAPFAVGGVGGVLYQYLLQASVDAVGQESAALQKGGRQILSSPLTRVALLAGLGVAAYFYLMDGDHDAISVYGARQLLNFGCGLLTFKVAAAIGSLSVESTTTEP